MVALQLQLTMLISVLLHELGHCFSARSVNGDANEILLWPLGGLAFVDVPNTPRANLITVIGGPAVNVVLCIVAGAGLLLYGYVPPMPPFTGLFWDWVTPEVVGRLSAEVPAEMNTVLAFLARLFWLNWFLFWFNMLLVAFPMDAGRILQCILWPRLGLQAATRVVIYTGWGVAVLLALFVVVFFEKATGSELFILFALALFIYHACRQEQILLESGLRNEDGVFGYDFSQGYTSLEKGEPPPRKKPRPGVFQRWMQRRAERRKQREEQERLHDETRLDQLLEKVRQEGMQALSDEERRFLNRVSAKLRNRNQS
jgi:Zn-dependent protease